MTCEEYRAFVRQLSGGEDDKPSDMDSDAAVEHGESCQSCSDWLEDTMAKMEFDMMKLRRNLQ